MLKISDGLIRQTILEQTPELKEQQPAAQEKIAVEKESIVQATPEYASGLLAERRLGSYAQEMYLRNQLDVQLKSNLTPDAVAAPSVQLPQQPPITGVPPGNAEPEGGIEVGKGQSGLKTDPASLIPIPLQQHSQGEEVKLLQMELNKWRTANGKEPFEVTGYFGKTTEEALKEFQRASNIKDDGIFGPISKHHMIVENNHNFQQLPDNDKAAVRQRMLQYGSGTDEDSRREMIVRFATHPDYLGSDSSIARTNVLNYLDASFESMPYKGSEKDIKNMENYLSQRSEMAKDESFQALDQTTKDKIDEESQAYLFTKDRNMEHLKIITTSDSFSKLERDSDTILLALRRIAMGGEGRVSQFQGVLDNSTGLDEGVKTRVLTAAHRNGMTDIGVQNLNTLVSSPAFKAATPQMQNSMMDMYFLFFPGSDIEILSSY